jgi:hypothetical protein
MNALKKAKAARARVPAAGQLFRVAESLPTDLEEFCAALAVEVPGRARSWPRQGGRVALACDRATCRVLTVRVEVLPALTSWQRTPTLYCPCCGDPLRAVRRLEVVALTPVGANEGAMATQTPISDGDRGLP